MSLAATILGILIGVGVPSICTGVACLCLGVPQPPEKP